MAIGFLCQRQENHGIYFLRLPSWYFESLKKFVSSNLETEYMKLWNGRLAKNLAAKSQNDISSICMPFCSASPMEVFSTYHSVAGHALTFSWKGFWAIFLWKSSSNQFKCVTESYNTDQSVTDQPFTTCWWGCVLHYKFSLLRKIFKLKSMSNDVTCIDSSFIVKNSVYLVSPRNSTWAIQK